MAATTNYAINVSDASGTGSGPYTCTIFKSPSQVAATPTVPTVTTGPLGSSGTAAATTTNGAGSAVGFLNLGEAIERAKLYILDDKAINNT